MDDEAKELAEKIWKECTVVCPHNGEYPCYGSHGHGLELDENKVAALITAHDTVTRAKALREAADTAKPVDDVLAQAILALIPQPAPL